MTLGKVHRAGIWTAAASRARFVAAECERRRPVGVCAHTASVCAYIRAMHVCTRVVGICISTVNTTRATRAVFDRRRRRCRPLFLSSSPPLSLGRVRYLRSPRVTRKHAPALRHFGLTFDRNSDNYPECRIEDNVSAVLVNVCLTGRLLRD